MVEIRETEQYKRAKRIETFQRGVNIFLDSLAKVIRWVLIIGIVIGLISAFIIEPKRFLFTIGACAVVLLPLWAFLRD